MKNFKILALKPLKGCETRFTKSLKAGELYCFYNNYEFKESKDKITSIEKRNIFPEDYFNITNNSQPISINISAIVGKNGAGKSTLFELIYYSVFVIANKAGIIEPSFKIFEENLGDNTITEQQRAICELEKSELDFVTKGLKVSIYYELDESFYCLTVDNDVKLDFLNGTSEKTREVKINKILGIDNDFFEDFFYSISINYSLHGLNSKQIGFWIENLFHKNDGYQTPLVINPMRTDGNIDVNSEFHLAQSRMLSNLTSLDSDTPEVVNRKTLTEVEFTIDPSEIDSLNHLAIVNIFQAFEQKHSVKIFDFFSMLSKGIIEHEIPEERLKLLENKWEEDRKQDAAKKFHYNDKPSSISYDDIYYLLAKYVVRKVFKIVMQYNDYKEKFSEKHNLKYKNGQEISVNSIKKFEELISALKNDPSHITYKVRQALYSIKESYFNISWAIELDPVTGYNYRYKSKMDYSLLKAKINKSFSDNEKTAKEKIVVIPCALVKPAFIIELPESSGSKSNFHTMSSGELQFAFTIHSVLYHIQNINSVVSTKENKKIKYRNINLMLDETELYFHPEFQQHFIDQLLRGIGKYKINEIDSINIMFLTHSPFILSDIPAINILKLDKGVPILYEPTEFTLGANIHSLLANDFYLSKGFIGERVRQTLNELFSFLQDKKPETYTFSEQSAKLFITNIGEPVLKYELSKLYDLKYSSSFEIEIIEDEMKRLQKLKSKRQK